MKATDYAWAAGLFDGEGSVCYTNPKDRPNPRIHLTMSMTDRKAVEKFYSIVEVGNINILRHYEKQGYQRQYRWHSEKALDVAHVIKYLGPYLVTKKPVMNKALRNWHRNFNANKSKNWKFILAKVKEKMPNVIP